LEVEAFRFKLFVLIRQGIRVLIVARCKNGKYAPFISEQVDAIEKQGVECRYFGVDGKGITGYLRQIPRLKKALRDFHPDIIHAHYGLCGLLANYQTRIPVVTTYHGSDINAPKVLRLSQGSIRRSRYNIFVSQRNVDIACPPKEYAMIPCGINLEDYPVIDKLEARRQMGLDSLHRYVLFSGAFDNPVKNAPLAKAAMELVPNAELLELKGFSRPQVAAVMQAVDVFLMTSFTEGSPQVVKEALACGCPIVSVDVGDVKERIEGIGGCYISGRDPEALARSIKMAMDFAGRTDGRQVIKNNGLSNDVIAARIISVYENLLS
jgi:glycosyltransferase involved in cell wall biosynthesis